MSYLPHKRVGMLSPSLDPSVDSEACIIYQKTDPEYNTIDTKNGRTKVTDAGNIRHSGGVFERLEKADHLKLMIH